MAQTLKQFWIDLNNAIDARLSLRESLNLIAKNPNRIWRFTEAINSINGEVGQGSLFYKALAGHPEFFGEMEVALIRAGEMGSVLESTIGRLASNPSCTKSGEYKNFYVSLGICCFSGMSILNSLEIAGKFCSGSLKKAIDGIQLAIFEGKFLSEAMASSGVFCNEEIEMIDVGENTASLDNTLRCLADLC
ncbi:MAG: type II secretion system F family protein [Candidatus Buchananbacteria bacterium]|nr:type II secretion system F family protein [Candidatus Buchananbacteria bacterium]